jgi:hypothetical protein
LLLNVVFSWIEAGVVKVWWFARVYASPFDMPSNTLARGSY